MMSGALTSHEQIARFSGLRVVTANRTKATGVPRVRVPGFAIRARLSDSETLSLSGTEVFGENRELTQLQSVVQSLTAPVRYAVCSALVVGAAAIGYAAGSKLTSSGHVDAAEVAEGGPQGSGIGGIAGAAVLGAAGAGAAYLFNKETTEVAATEIHNALSGLATASALDPTVVVSITEKYGVSPDDERIRDEKKALYDRFVTAVLPPGNESLTGNEADVITAFKESLAIEDEDAAAVHIEIGRRIFRQRLETGDKETALEERKSFQKLLYVSSLVFGAKAKFLLPWKRLFKVSDAQVDISIRNNAQALFQDELDAGDFDADVAKLKALRKFQKQIRLADDIAADMVRAQARLRVEGLIKSALDVLKARTRLKDMGKVVSELDALRAYNASLSDVAKAAPAEELVPGVGPVSVFGGEFDADRQMDDLKLLYKAYLAEALADSGILSDEKVNALSDLRNIFGMGRKAAEEATAEVTGKAYKRLLANAVTSGALDKAASKAEFLQDLCDNLRFDPDLATAMHADIYRTKLQQCLEDKALSDDDVAALNRLRVLLCVPKSVVDEAHGDVCGDIFTKVVDEAIGAGVDGYDGDMREAVQKAVKGLRLPLQAALDIATKAVRAVFLTYIKRARSTMGRTEAARELKKMVLFSNLTVSQLLDDIRGGEKVVEQADLGEGGKMLAAAAAASEAGEKEEDKKEEEKEEEVEEDGDLTMLQSMRKTRGKAKEGKAQREVNIKEDLELRERLDLYKTFLLFCLQGDTTGMPMGTALVVQRDTSDFVRLGQLGDILGLAPGEVASVHQDLAEQAFKVQAQTILADGQLSKARAEQLKELQQQLGLPDASAQKVVQSITSTKMAGAIDAAVRQGKLTPDEVRKLKESGVDIETMVGKKVREQMFEKIVRKELDSGSAVFNREEVLEKLPADLGLEREEAERKVKEIASERLRGALVQAASSLRQKKRDLVVASLNNLLACDSISPAPEALSWPVKSELYDLYSVFIGQNDAAAPTAARLRELLDIDESTAGSLEDVVESGSFSLDILDPTAEEKFVF